MPELLDDFALEEGPSVDGDAREHLRGYIGSAADQLYWAAQPKQGLLLFRKEEGCRVLFFGFFFLFSVIWETVAIWSGAGWLFMIWGIPFVAIGGYLFIGRFIHDAWYRRRMYYGLTKTTLYILRGSELTTHTLRHIRVLKRIDRIGDLDDILFSETSTLPNMNANAILPARQTCLLGVEHSLAIYDWLYERSEWLQ